jgi:hypothetical protein
MRQVLNLPITQYYVSLKEQKLFFYHFNWKIITLPKNFFFKFAINSLSIKGSLINSNYQKFLLLFKKLFTDLYFFKLRIKVWVIEWGQLLIISIIYFLITLIFFMFMYR